MIEESATVVRTEGELAWLETRRKSACGSCSVNKGCGTSVLAKVMGNKTTLVCALNRAEAKAGEQVIVGIEDQALVRGSLAVYAVPLLALLGGAMLGDYLQGMAGMSGEGLVILGALSGFGVGFGWLRRYARQISRDERYQPVVLRRVV